MAFMPRDNSPESTLFFLLDGYRFIEGEWITIALMKTGVKRLTRSMTYDIPEQDLRVRQSRMPAIPKSRLVIRRVRRIR